MWKVLSNKSLNRNALKAGLWYTISSVMLRAVSIITTPIYTRLMSTSDYGIVSTFTSWYTLLLVFSSLNLTYSIGKAKQDFPGELDEYVFSMQCLSAIFTSILIILTIIFIKPLCSLFELNLPVTIVLIFYLLVSPSILFVQSKYRFQYRYKENIAISVYTTIFSVILSLIFIFVFKEEKYLGRILGIAIPPMLLSIVIWISGINHRSNSTNKEYWKYGLRISLPLMIHVISINVLIQSDRLIINKFCGIEATGIYSLAYQYAILISVVTNAICDAWQPWFFDKYEINEFNEINKKSKLITILGCFISIWCIAVGPEAIVILGGKAYDSGKWAVCPVTLAILCQYVYTHYVNVEMYLKKTKYISIGTIIAAILNIILNFIFVPQYGFIAAAYSTFFSYLVLMIVHFIIVTKILKVNIYQDSFLFVSILVASAIAVIFMVIYNYVCIRYTLLTLISFAYIFLNRKNIKNVIAKS